VTTGLLDLLLGELFIEGAADERGQFCVGGEAQADDLAEGEAAAAREVLGGGTVW